MTKIAIITRPDYRSPRILAESLKSQIEKAGHIADIFFDIDALTRLRKYSETNKSIKYHYWLRKKISNYFKDLFLLKKLNTYDAIVISECSPNGFWRNLYHVEELRGLINKPILYHEVYYLQNAPTQIDKLMRNKDPMIERYDFHLALTDVTEIKSLPNKHWASVGLDMTNWGLSYRTKNEFVALVDFVQDGYEKYQQEQIKALENLNIKYVVLKGSYSISEIRNLYKHSAVLFLQFPEAFGMPIAECLACGVQIFTPNSGWPMSWRLDDNPAVHGSGILPSCFTVYDGEIDLKMKLLSFKEQYDLKKTPKSIFDHFISNYSYLYSGNSNEVKRAIDFISSNKTIAGK